ncbi:hypothetical protein PR048_031472 [Dryococelus australis]|uniref:Uncharacterized protein n=1 Tax=Dryococelus australis TaxID=614101 RepID=A0ABQ9G5C6_9NEOP|nr:hypothetical protein PR048_031472 [Dryococelus australis]
MKRPISQERDCLLLLKMFFVVSSCHFNILGDNWGQHVWCCQRSSGNNNEKKKKLPKAQYYHCANHSLNLALRDCVKKISLY